MLAPHLESLEEKPMLQFKRAVLACLLVVFIASCGGGGSVSDHTAWDDKAFWDTSKWE